jgi:transposase
MQANSIKASAAIRVDLAAIFVSLELSRSKWLVTSISPGGGEKMSKFIIAGGDIAGLFAHFSNCSERPMPVPADAFPSYPYRSLVLMAFGSTAFSSAKG